ncbi:aminotransferase [Neisseria gonorrhoeae]|uniref:Aminotransferase n=1 Tax=Neisseria gonorrhoeae TaxID=485 RepID=A0A378VVA4_NEIGO|nr:aminotransferase [Neisseria gonorrhoeae]
MDKFPKSAKLDHVCYDIRGTVHKKALQLEEEGNKSSSSISATLRRSALKHLMKS